MVAILVHCSRNHCTTLYARWAAEELYQTQRSKKNIQGLNKNKSTLEIAKTIGRDHRTVKKTC